MYRKISTLEVIQDISIDPDDQTTDLTLLPSYNVVTELREEISRKGKILQELEALVMKLKLKLADKV